MTAAFISPSVKAQAKNFEGFGIQISTGYQNNDIKPSNFSLNGISAADQFGAGFSDSSNGEMPSNLGVGYTFALSDKFMLGALVEYNPLKINSGTTATFGGVISTNPVHKVSSSLENQVSISILPGYSFSDSTMGYARIGWINSTFKAKAGDGLGVSENTNGILFGLGAKHLFTKNVVKINHTPTSYSFLVGVGALF